MTIIKIFKNRIAPLLIAVSFLAVFIYSFNAEASAGANLSVLPKVAGTDNLIGATGAQWKFNVTTTAELASGDVVRFVLPQVAGGQPFAVSTATTTAISGITLYSSLGADLSNLLLNSSFEDTTTSWSYSAPGSSVGFPTSSNYSNGSSALGFTTVGSDLSIFLQQVSLTQNSQHAISFYAKGSSGGETVRLILEAIDPSCSDPGYAWRYNFASSSWNCDSNAVLSASTSPYTLNANLTTSFQRTSLTFNSSPTTSVFRVSLAVGGDAAYAGQTVFVDAVQLEQGGSPTAYNEGGSIPAIVGVSSVQKQGGQMAIYGYVNTTTPSGTTSSITLGGINNGAAQLSSVSNLTWTVEAGTLADPQQVGGGFVSDTAKFSYENTEGLTRAGGALVSNKDSSITATSYATGTVATYTFAIAATSSIPSGGQVVVNIPTDYSLAGVTVNLSQNISNNTTTTIASFTTTTSAGINRVALTTAGDATNAGDIITVAIGGLTNPTTAAVYRPFSVYSAKANGGLLDGSTFGFETGDYGGGSPPPVDTVHIGGNNTINVVVYKRTGSTNELLSGGELTQVKIGIGCPDKGFFIGEKWLNASASVSVPSVLDCNYMVNAMPFDQSNSSFYDSFLPPSFKSVNAVGGQTVTTSLIFGVPDATVVFQITGGVAGQQAFINAFSPDFQTFNPVYTDATYATAGFSATGTGYARLKVKSGQTWGFNVEGGQFGGAGNFSSGGSKFWPPTIPSAYIGSSGTTTLPNAAFVEANKTLVVTLNKSGGGTVNDACVGVKRTGGGMYMGAQDTICQPNSGSDYSFKVPLGTVAVQVMRMGFGQPTEYPVGITAATTTKTITLSSPTTFISVTVRDAAGNAISGAPIFAHGSSGFGQSQTNSAGTTTLYLAAGSGYTVEGFAPGLGPLTAQTGKSTGDSVTFTVNSASFKTISGRVTAGGTGVSGVNIGARGTGSTSGGNGTQTDSDGNYLLYVPAGTYEVGGWSDDTGGLPPISADVSSGNATGKNFAIGGGGTLRVTVTNATNVSPLFAGVFDPSTGRGNGTDSWTTSGTSKIADIKLPAASTYEIHVGSPLIGEIGSATGITITAGQTTNQSFNAAASTTLVTLSGTVTTTGGNVANATVWASRQGGPGFFSALTDSNGAYSLNVPDERTYLVGVKILGYVAASGDVQKAVSGNTTQNFTMTAAGSAIAGQITGNSLPLSTAWVTAKKTVNGNDVWTGGPTDASGNYSLSVDSGTWTVYAEGPCYQRSSGLSAAASSTGKDIALTAISGCSVPTPQINGVTAASGGQVSKTGLILDIPANALGTGQTTVSVSVVTTSVVVATANATPLKNSVQTISATDSTGQAVTSLNSNVNLTLTYDPLDLPNGFDESTLQLGYFDTNSGQWESVAATVDTTNNKITASVSHFTDYGPILPGVPEAPAGLTATAASASQINLSWDASQGADYYIIYRSLTNSNFTSSIATTSGTSYSNTSLTASTRYYYKVAGYNSNGEGANSASANAITSAAVAGGTSGGGGGAAQDTTAPTNTSIVIAGNATSTATQFVPLTLGAVDAVYMMLGNDTLTDAGWEMYATSKAWTLTPGIGTKSVYAKFKDASGNISTPIFDTISLTSSSTSTVPAASTTTATIATSTTAQTQSPSQTQAQTSEVQTEQAKVTARFIFTGNLAVGSIGAEVKNLQTLLKEMGYFTYPRVTGYFGAVTKQAVLAYQKAKGIALTGKTDAATRLALSLEAKNKKIAVSVPKFDSAIFTMALSLRSKGDQVSKLQVKLKELRHFSYPSITGYFGTVTKNAVIAYQKAKGLNASGILDAATRASLNGEALPASDSAKLSEPAAKEMFTLTLKAGSSGTQVKALQEKLKKLGFFTHPSITGYFGAVTQAAVVKFQKANGLAPFPGWVGPGTRAALNSK